jgi:hypothetical protein
MMRVLLLLGALLPGFGFAYPLDGADYSGIQRLLGYQYAQTLAKGPKLPPGALLSIRDIRLNLVEASPTPFDAAPPDPDLQHALEAMLAARDPSYGVVVVDISNPDAIAWAAVRPDVQRFPGSINKIVTMAALFDGLARAFPAIADRERILKTTRVTGRDWVLWDEHDIPTYDRQTGANTFAHAKPTDTFNLAEWIDHMISPSANAAGAVVWREAMLLRQFGADYPVPDAVADAFFRDTPKKALTELSLAVNRDPLARIGLHADSIQQGSLWTKTGKRYVPGVTSHATPRSLARFVYAVEQGRLVDSWSSLEMKRYLYMTKRRYRYAFAPELARANIYFKSGSYYACHAEEGFRCGKYAGNTKNFMNVVVVVEWPNEPIRYLVSLMSNVLKVNSAWDHARIAVAIDQMIRTRRAAAIDDAGNADQVREAGRG